jgi:GR25 family glycosyltransferase involved in LPS biosynthesis
MKIERIPFAFATFALLFLIGWAVCSKQWRYSKLWNDHRAAKELGTLASREFDDYFESSHANSLRLGSRPPKHPRRNFKKTSTKLDDADIDGNDVDIDIGHDEVAIDDDSGDAGERQSERTLKSKRKRRKKRSSFFRRAERIQRDEAFKYSGRLKNVGEFDQFDLDEYSFGAGSTKLCVAITTVRRKNVDYLKLTLASLLRPLSKSQRGSMLIKLIDGDLNWRDESDGDDVAPAVALTPWVDEVVHYSQDDIALASSGSDFKFVSDVKLRIDYARAFEACLAENSDYMMVLEDDLVACSDWYVRLTSMLGELTATMRSDNARDWQRLQLFYTGAYLNWDSASEFAAYALGFGALVGSAAYALGVIALLALQRSGHAPLHQSSKRQQRGSKSPRCRVKAISFAATLVVGIALCAGIMYLSGRTNLVNDFDVGLNRLESGHTAGYCCAQAIIVAKSMAQSIADFQRNPPRAWARDILLNKHERKHQLDRYIAFPSLFDHIGYQPSMDKLPHVKLASNELDRCFV